MPTEPERAASSSLLALAATKGTLLARDGRAFAFVIFAIAIGVLAAVLLATSIPDRVLEPPAGSPTADVRQLSE